jgi:sugar phosphate isomerase/epimerase
MREIRTSGSTRGRQVTILSPAVLLYCASVAIMKKMPYPFRFAMCNEAFEKRPFAEVCRTLRSVGYAGIEIAPFTLADDPLAIRADRRRELRDIIVSEGLEFVGLHWLLVVPFPIHVTTPDLALRERSWQYVRGLIDLCADLSPDASDSHGIMVFGSPKQRSSTGGITAAEAVRNYVAGLAGIAGHAEDRGVTILVEALPYSQSDVIHTLEEAVAVVREIGSPAVKTMFDTHNAEDETEPHGRLIERCCDLIRHIHLNEMDGGHPGTANYDFAPIFAILGKLAYKGWVSVEAFDFAAGAETIARESLEYMKKAALHAGSIAHK